MPPTTNRCVAGTLTVSQTIGLTKIALTREYDIAVTTVSWEHRAATAFNASSNLPSIATLLRFESGDVAMDERKDEVQAQLSALFSSAQILKLNKSTEFSENAELMEVFFRDEFKKKKRPLRILVDITCIPKSYLLFIIGMNFSCNYVSRIDCVYAEGNYNLEEAPLDSASGDIGLISEGEWDALQLPYLGADSAIPANRDLVVSMGGEIGLSLSFIERYEPRRLGLVLIKEGLAQTPERLPPTEAVALKRILDEGNVERFDIALADAVGMIERTLKYSRGASSETVSGIALGSKPHALALAVAALDRDNLEIICRVPKRYRPLDVLPAGPLALYEIEDRFEPSGYFTGVLKT